VWDLDGLRLRARGGRGGGGVPGGSHGVVRNSSMILDGVTMVATRGDEDEGGSSGINA
jgi:hypothetical protein